MGCRRGGIDDLYEIPAVSERNLRALQVVAPSWAHDGGALVEPVGPLLTQQRGRVRTSIRSAEAITEDSLDSVMKAFVQDNFEQSTAKQMWQVALLKLKEHGLLKMSVEQNVAAGGATVPGSWTVSGKAPSGKGGEAQPFRTSVKVTNGCLNQELKAGDGTTDVPPGAAQIKAALKVQRKICDAFYIDNSQDVNAILTTLQIANQLEMDPMLEKLDGGNDVTSVVDEYAAGIVAGIMTQLGSDAELTVEQQNLISKEAIVDAVMKYPEGADDAPLLTAKELQGELVRNYVEQVHNLKQAQEGPKLPASSGGLDLCGSRNR